MPARLLRTVSIGAADEACRTEQCDQAHLPTRRHWLCGGRAFIIIFACGRVVLLFLPFVELHVNL